MSSTDQQSPVRSKIRLLGRILGETIAQAEGQPVLDSVEAIRRQAKAARHGDEPGHGELYRTLQALDDSALLPIARSFSHFLNLVNIIEQHEGNRQRLTAQQLKLPEVDTAIDRLLGADQEADSIATALLGLDMELVLTPHPTEIARRTLIDKHAQIDACLSEIDAADDDAPPRTLVRLRRLIAELWHTDEIRTSKPSPLDEASWGFAVIENSLWQAVPEFLRRLDTTARTRLDSGLPLDARPLRLASWMGGDRDGNPNVTAEVTRRVLLLARWKAADLYLGDIEQLISELSMHRCNHTLRELAGEAREPYRHILRQLRELLGNTRSALGRQLAGDADDEARLLTSTDQLRAPLLTCYQSLHDCDMGLIADGSLLDTLRRVTCFGVQLVSLDVRQESDRHTEALARITGSLGLGDYAAWSEHDRIAFLAMELNSKRPLLPRDWAPPETVAEVLASCRIVAQQLPGSISCYVISMTSSASDVLAVALLLKECGCRQALPIVPLFETLDDLEAAATVIDQLLQIPWYRAYCGDRQMVMIGYSDSSKDAGVMAASWAQYRAQEQLLEVAGRHGVALQLFHGRGGTTGRGGAPAFTALFSQPPGSLRCGLRVTEQGEMIRFKLGHPETAIGSLGLYASAIIEANMAPPPQPAQAWREIMDSLSERSCQAYRDLVRGHPDFIAYFREATPETELSMLPLGSRPTRRRSGGGLASLRAIPWIFAWSQNRMMLPAWLGAGQALGELVAEGKLPVLQAMYRDWPFFAARLSMLEMVYAKADPELAAYYDEYLVDPALQPLGKDLRAQLEQDIDTVLSVSNDDSLMADVPAARESVRLRNTYTDPLNLLQVELLRRYRSERSEEHSQALMVSIAGIAAGLRNTG